MKLIKNIEHVFLLFVCIVTFNKVLGQQEKYLDSLALELEKTDIHDTTYLNILFELGEKTPIFRISYWDSIVMYSLEFLPTSKNKTVQYSIKSTRGDAYNNIGYIYKHQGKVVAAIHFYEKSMEILKSIGNKRGEAVAYNNIGTIFQQQGNFKKSLEYFKKSLVIKEEIGDKEGLALSLNNIGALYQDQVEGVIHITNENDSLLNNALHYFDRALEIQKEIDDESGTATTYNNMGTIYEGKKDYQKAISYFKKAYLIQKKNNNLPNVANILNNMASTHSFMGQNDNAATFYLEAYEIYNDLGYKADEAFVLGNLGRMMLKMGSINEAEIYAIKSMEIAEELGFSNLMMGSTKLLFNVNKEKKKFELALVYLERYNQLSDSVMTDNNAKAVLQQHFQYEYGKKVFEDSIELEKNRIENEIEMSLSKKELELNRLEIESQRKQTWVMYFFFAIMVFLGFFAYNRFKAIRRQKEIIIKQKKVGDSRFALLKGAHDEMTDSIVYTKRLQDAILPSFEDFKKEIKNSFIVFKPKDILSGDFYWNVSLDFSMENGKACLVKNNLDLNVKQAKLFAVADCTGHGIPGAMVSIVCVNALNRAVKEFGYTCPADILSKTKEIVVSTFSNNKKEIRDGMDIGLCAIIDDVVIFSGANNSLLIVRKVANLNSDQLNDPLILIKNNIALIEIKGDKNPIGLYGEVEYYNKHRVKLLKGDTIYLATDGFSDQFGGVKGKKFKSKYFKKMLLEINDKSMPDQKEYLSKTFESWKGDLEQVDDVSIVGVRFDSLK